MVEFLNSLPGYIIALIFVLMGVLPWLVCNWVLRAVLHMKPKTKKAMYLVASIGVAVILVVSGLLFFPNIIIAGSCFFFAFLVLAVVKFIVDRSK